MFSNVILHSLILMFFISLISAKSQSRNQIYMDAGTVAGLAEAPTGLYLTRTECSLRCLAIGCQGFSLAPGPEGGYYCSFSTCSANMNNKIWSHYRPAEQNLAVKKLISGADHFIPDTSLTASSVYSNLEDHGPKCSRLSVAKPTFCFSPAWAAGSNSIGEWIQADLESTFMVTAVATSGRGPPITKQRVTSYKLAVVCQGQKMYYSDGTKDKVFQGNLVISVTVKNILNPAMLGRYIRLYPQTWNHYMSLRWELYGK